VSVLLTAKAAFSSVRISFEQRFNEQPANIMLARTILSENTQVPMQQQRVSSADMWRRLGRAIRFGVAGLTALAFLFGQTAVAYAGGLIRDAEIEALIADYAAPIMRVAGLGSHNINIHIINDQSFNAFVIDGQNMFIHTGAIMKAETPNQLIGVIAHETGHISGGHLARLQVQIGRMQSAALIMNVLGIGAMVGGAVSGQSEVGQGGAAVLYGGQSVIQRSVLSYRRVQESSADQAAVNFLNQTKQSGLGMLETFRQLGDQSLGTLQYIDPYLQSHPMPQDRVIQLRGLVEQSSYYHVKDSPQLQFRHDMARAKLFAFINKANPQAVYRKYPEKDQSLPARYARAIAKYHTGGMRSAVGDIDRLIAEQPNNPYFYELKGQFFLESGDARAAIAPLHKAVDLAPNSGLIRVMLAQAQIATNDQGVLKDAVSHLQKALTKEKQSVIGYRQLAIAYGRLNRIPEAELASAQGFFYEGNADYAKFHAERAIKAFPEGSPNWNVANDVINDVITYKKLASRGQ
jgi:predicted Zn-dependent protease